MAGVVCAASADVRTSAAERALDFCLAEHSGVACWDFSGSQPEVTLQQSVVGARLSLAASAVKHFSLLGAGALPDPLLRLFVHGYVDQGARLDTSQGEPRLVVRVSAQAQRAQIEQVLGPPSERDRWGLSYLSVAALDAAGRLFDRPSCVAQNGEQLATYRNWCDLAGPGPSVSAPNAVFPGTFRVARARPDAVLPQKSRVSDSGYDVTLLAVAQTRGPVVLYSTGLLVQPPHGWYFDLVPRSSIIKSGYMLANNVGIIDRAYRGELLVPLVKIDQDAVDLVLPQRMVQLIPRPIAHFCVQEVSSLDQTERAGRGFGSSG